MELFDDGETGENAQAYTVSEISGAVKRTLEGAFGRVRVRGEIGRVSRPGSGHIYFDLKDDRAVIAAVCWKGQAAKLAHLPEQGLEMIAEGRLTTFPGQSRYQLIVDDIRPAGAGALMAMLEARRKALEAEGLFQADRKRPLPFLPEVIGVVTSPQGAVIRDILHRLRERFPRKVLVWPVAVQGQASAAQVAAAIRGFNALSPGGALPRPDVLIVARGGGSIEDLWGFNEEIVVRAAADSQIPLISAVGHETDTTLIDHAADRRAPTPTAAAEIAVPVRLDLQATLDAAHARLSRALSQGVTLRQRSLADLARALPRPDRLTERARQRLDMAEMRLPAALRGKVQHHRARLGELSAGLRPASLTRAIADRRERSVATAARLAPALARATRDRRRDLDRLSTRLTPRQSQRLIAAGQGDLASVSSRLDRAAAARTAAAKERLSTAQRLLETLSHHGTLARGYAIVRSGDTVLTTKAAAAEAGALEIEFQDGRLPIGGTAKPKRAPKKPPTQGSLF